MRWARSPNKPSIEITRVKRTDKRPGSEGTYIVRLSRANVRQLKIRNGAYLKVSYGEASVIACLSVDETLDEETIRIDQTLRTALYLERVMQGSREKELVYTPDKRGNLAHPIIIQRSKFRGPSVLARLVKQQYLICTVHIAMAEDMEKPIVRLPEDSMKVIGIQPGDKVLLISEKGRKRVRLRCLALDPKKQLPLETMKATWPLPNPDASSTDQELNLPWITLDLQTRLELGVDPWQPIIVGRDPYHALTSEFTTVAMALALSALGGAVVIPQILQDKHPWLPLSIILASFAIVSILIGLKIRSRI
jgi:hypothetical protein